MIIDFDNIKPQTRYHLLTQTVTPRPIAWVLSANDDLSLNLAPFSYFNAMCSDPPLLAMSIGKKVDGEIKDTRRNMVSGRDFVVHIASAHQAAALNASSKTLGYGDSELKLAGLPVEPFEGCNVPRLSECKVAFHCEFYDVHELGAQRQAIIYAMIKRLYLNEEIVDQKDNRYMINPKKLDPLARLGGSFFSSVGRVFSIKRPD